MGSRRVLGNDPFQRGAAERPVTPQAPPPDGPPAKGATASRRGARAPEAGSSGGHAPPVGSTATRGKSSRSGGKRGASTTGQVAGKPAAPARVHSAHPPAAKHSGATVSPPTRSTQSTVPGAALPHSPPPASSPAPSSSVPRAGAPMEPPPPVPPAPSAPTLSWTPLTDSTPAPEPEPPVGTATTAGGGLLVEALREAPGLLAEAWSAIEAAIRAFRAGLGTAGGEQLDVYGRDARLSEAVAPLVDFLYSRWFRVEVEGAAHVPAGGALMVANHAGALPLDGPMLHEALRRERPDLPEARWLAEDQVFYAPLLGTLFNRLGAVRASPDSAVRLLGEGRPVLVFPEGIQGIGKPFRDRYRLQRFGRGGFVKLGLRTGRPILPVAIMGAEETLPLLGKLPGGLLGVPYVPVTPLPLPLPAKWRIRIGEPIAVPAGAKETDLSVVESLVEATRSTIEQMLRELLGARGGVFLG